MRYLKFLSVIVFTCISSTTFSKPPGGQYYEIRIYHLNNADQEKRVDGYLRNALIPALHQNSIVNVGVFKPLANDTAADRKIYVIIPYKSLEQFSEIGEKVEKDKNYQS